MAGRGRLERLRSREIDDEVIAVELDDLTGEVGTHTKAAPATATALFREIGRAHV